MHGFAVCPAYLPAAALAPAQPHPAGPLERPEYGQVEMFVYLVDVPEELGPPHLVSTTLTHDPPARPNWYPQTDLDPGGDDFVSPVARPQLYEAEVSAAGPAGTVVAFQPGTFHRGTALRRPRGALAGVAQRYPQLDLTPWQA